MGILFYLTNLFRKKKTPLEERSEKEILAEKKKIEGELCFIDTINSVPQPNPQYLKSLDSLLSIKDPYTFLRAYHTFIGLDSQYSNMGEKDISLVKSSKERILRYIKESRDYTDFQEYLKKAILLSKEDFYEYLDEKERKR